VPQKFVNGKKKLWLIEIKIYRITIARLLEIVSFIAFLTYSTGEGVLNNHHRSYNASMSQDFIPLYFVRAMMLEALNENELGR
jgi:hypothetical protein